jgi:hypothetical protein
MKQNDFVGVQAKAMAEAGFLRHVTYSLEEDQLNRGYILRQSFGPDQLLPPVYPSPIRDA